MVRDCDSNWWTSIAYANDFIPYFAKDLVGCMRWTAVFAIEMQLFLMVPLIAYVFKKGFTWLSIFFTFQVAGFGLVAYYAGVLVALLYERSKVKKEDAEKELEPDRGSLSLRDAVYKYLIDSKTSYVLLLGFGFLF